MLVLRSEEIDLGSAERMRGNRQIEALAVLERPPATRNTLVRRPPHGSVKLLDNPHNLKSFSLDINWRVSIIFSSLITAKGAAPCDGSRFLPWRWSG